VSCYVLDNARMFLAEYHVDGLRLDAVHALVDSGTPHILEEVGVEAEAWSARSGRPLSLIAESDLNDPGMFTPREAVFEPLSALAKVLTRGFLHDGTLSTFRGRLHGKPIDTARTSNWRLVVANQNHDQIGTRAIGDRLSATLDEHQLSTASELTLLGPELGRATAQGRINEFARLSWDPAQVPDPQDPATFLRSKLDWSEPVAPRFAARTAALALWAADAFTPNGARVHRSRPAHPDQPGGGPSSPPALIGSPAVLLKTIARPDAHHVAFRSATVYRPA
jgi:maltooligosyltrehalose trehalohydrolase